MGYNLFGPLTKDSCTYFYFFAVAGFIMMIVFLLFILVALIVNYKKLNTPTIINLIAAVINSFLLYFSNRLLYTMCVKIL